MPHIYTVILRREPQGGYSVVVPALLGCVTEGETIPEALTMAREAIECYLESLIQHGEPVPEEGPTLSFERAELTEGFIFRVTATPQVEAHA